MKKYLTNLVLCGLLTISYQASAADPTELLIKLQRDIFKEMLRSHGPQIEDKAVLTWCELKDLAEEIGLSKNGLKRAVYDWDIYNNSLFSDLSRYQQGIQRGLYTAYPTEKAKADFCQQAEQKAFKTAQTVSH